MQETADRKNISVDIEDISAVSQEQTVEQTTVRPGDECIDVFSEQIFSPQHLSCPHMCIYKNISRSIGHNIAPDSGEEHS